MEVRKIVVVVEDVDAARTALRWALHNLYRYGDVLVLLHVFSASRSRRRTRQARLRGFHLALSFKEICGSFLNTNVEIVVAEGNEIAEKIAAVIRELDASFLLIGLHDRSFLYRLAMEQDDLVSRFSCRVIAIKQPSSTVMCSPKRRGQNQPSVTLENAPTTMDFSQIDLSRLQLPSVTRTKISYQICPDPYTILWRWRKMPKKRRSS